MAIKLIVCDIDGTLLDLRQRIHRDTLSGIEQAKDKGVTIALATGRGYAAAQKIAALAGIQGCPVIACNGASVFIGGKECSRSTLSPECIIPALDLAVECGVECFMLSHDSFYMYTTGDVSVDRSIVLDIASSPDEEKCYRVMQDIGDIDLVNNMGVEKLLMFSRRQEALSEARIRFERSVYYGSVPDCRVTSSGPYNFELVRRDVNKGVGLMQLAGMLGVQPEEILAVGSNENDVEMLRYAGISVAMGNARPGAIAASRHITLPVNEGGLGEAIRRYALG